LSNFELSGQAQIPGALPHGSFMSESNGNLRLLAVSGIGAARKMEWLASGKTKSQAEEKTLSNLYLLNSDFTIVESSQNLDLPSGVCAVRFVPGGVYAATCRGGNPFFGFNLNSGSLGARGTVAPAFGGAYLYPFADGRTLAVSQNGRKIKLELFDAAILSKTEKIFDYDLNGYWADFDAAYKSFAVDEKNDLVFLPAARGGDLLEINEGKIVHKKQIAGIAASRAFFKDGNLYLAGDDGIEVFGAPDFEKIKSIKF
jgi:uncharacterized secreted protein with C-terminal beta-propeller domain